MANASVEKLKALGLRQGEKFVVGIAASVLAVCAGLFATKETITTTPAELQTKAEQADSNLNRKQEPEAIIARIEEAGIKDPGFVKIVENQAANALKPGDYRNRLDWVTPEPGAGLIRDEPTLIAPTQLVAFPGRGGLLLYTLDDKFERIVDKSAEATRSNGRSGGMMTGGGGGSPSAKDSSKEDKERAEAEAAKRKNLFAGAPTPKDKADAKETEEATPDPNADGPWKQEIFGKRWVVITAVVDNAQLNKNWLDAVKNPAIAYPQYSRVEAQRQIPGPDGEFGGEETWVAVDEDAKYRVLDNMPAEDEELIALERRPETLVDPLPNLKAGYWTGVHVAQLATEEALKGPESAPNNSSGRGYRGGGGGESMPSGMGSMTGSGSGPGMLGGGSKFGKGMGSMSGSAGEFGGGSMGSGGGGASSGPEEAVVPNNEPTLMIRSIDFKVDPNTTYRYRLRLVIKNPNYQHTDVNPGVETTKEYLTSPWSKPTFAVTVPADVSAYAQNPVEDKRRSDVVNFQVVRWNPATGQTVVKTDDAGPGHLIGDYGSVLEPSDGKGANSVTIDFNSRSFLLDATGGQIRIPEFGVPRNPFQVPAVAMVVEPDGAVVIRNQATDQVDKVRMDMEANYRQALEDSKKKREGGGARGPGGMMSPGGGGGRGRKGGGMQSM